MAWDLFSSMELDLDKNEVNVVQSAQVEPEPVPTPPATKKRTKKKEPVIVKVCDGPVNSSIPTNDVLNELMDYGDISPQEVEQVVEDVSKNDLEALAVFDEDLVDSIETEHTEPCKNDETISYEVGDVVKIIYPTEEEDSEMYNYLHYYYSHLKGKKGRIVKVLPYKKLQYQVEVDIKHADRVITLYHENLLVFSY